MPYTPVTYNTGAAPGIDGPALDTIETQYAESLLSFGPDLFTPFVLSGLACTKDGTNPNQLDMTAGAAYLKQTDAVAGTRQRVLSAANFFTTGNPSTTLYLDLNSDGTISWHTFHSADANHLTLCTVTTDGSANIASVTDTRVTNTTLLPAMIGVLKAAGLVSVGAGNLANSPQIIIVGPSSSNLPAAGVKGRLAFVVPFSLP